MGEKRMRSKWIIRIWLGRLTRYLVVPLVFCVILFPLYGLMHQQTEKAQLTDAAEQLATAVSTFEGYLSDLRFTTNKLCRRAASANCRAAAADSCRTWASRSVFSTS